MDFENTTLHNTLPEERIQSGYLREYKQDQEMRNRATMEPFYDESLFRDIPDEFTDKVFEENYQRLIDRLNARVKGEPDKNLPEIKSIFEDMARIKEMTKTAAERKQEHKRRIEAPYKSSHISHIAALQSNKKGWSEGIRQYDAPVILNTVNIYRKN
jgi:hypothetical protein